jgi:imidazolonepropionase-like amidohydrolase
MAFSLICNGTLIDGTGTRPIADAAVLVEDGKIRAAGRRQDLPRPDAPVAEIDAGGGWILPGFIDAHVHIMMEGLDFQRRVTTPLSLNFYNAIDHMRRTLNAGITTVRDAAGADLGVKMAVEQGLIAGPRLQISITALTTTGGHGDYWLPSGVEAHLFAPYPGHPGGRCDGIEQVRQKVREVLRAGAEVIKVCATGGVMSPTDHPEFTQFSQAELEVMVEEGRFRRGVKVMAHAQGAEGIKNAVRAGIHSIEHGIYLDDEAIELMLRHGTFLVPTLLAPVAVVEAAEATGRVPDWALRKAKESLEAHRESIRWAHRAGVRIAMGTDAAVMPHGTNLRELGLLCGIGMTPMEAIVAGTKVAAECLGWQDRIGTVEAGKLADLIVTKTDPLADIRSLEKPDNIALVMKGGQIVKDRRAATVAAGAR